MRCINKYMLVIEVNVEFSMMIQIHAYAASNYIVGKLYCSQMYFFFQISLNAVQLYKYYMQ